MSALRRLAIGDGHHNTTHNIELCLASLTQLTDLTLTNMVILPGRIGLTALTNLQYLALTMINDRAKMHDHERRREMEGPKSLCDWLPISSLREVRINDQLLPNEQLLRSRAALRSARHST